MTTIRELMTADVLWVKPDTSLVVALDHLISRGVTGLPVVDDDMQIVGVISEKDLLQLFFEDRATVGEVMTPNPTMVAVDEPLHEVMDILMTASFRRVLIHDGKGKLVGLISRRDVMPAVLEVLRARSEGG